jgi:hypothetical protein
MLAVTLGTASLRRFARHLNKHEGQDTEVGVLPETWSWNYVLFRRSRTTSQSSTGNPAATTSIETPVMIAV